LDIPVGFIEGLAPDLATSDEDRSIRENNRGVEDTLIKHAARVVLTLTSIQTGHVQLDLLVGLLDGDDVGISGTERSIVELLPSEGEDPTFNGIEHDVIPRH
jgi:hypothetical protein